MPTAAQKTILLVSQVYLPDHAAVGMQIADAAAEFARRGFRVRVLTADRGYDDPSAKYPRSELLHGVEVLRLPFSSFGKRSIARRLLSGVLFVAQASLVGAFLKDVDAILVTTAPPIGAVSGLIVGAIRGAPLGYWVMDINPDQMVELGKVGRESPVVKVFDWLNRQILSRAAVVVTLDVFMVERLLRKMHVPEKISIFPPWPHENHLESIAHESNPFRKKHNLEGKFVVMYSGNHGPSSPITTCLDAAELLTERADIVFLFVGGGVGKAEVQMRKDLGASNILSLPYQPLEEIKFSLSAADVHLVTVGDSIVGVVHPSKIYGAMSIGRPILLTAPSKCHATPLVEPEGAGFRVDNGDAQGAAGAICRLADMPEDELQEMGRRAKEVINNDFSRQKLLGEFTDLMTKRLGLDPDR